MEDLQFLSLDALHPPSRQQLQTMYIWTVDEIGWFIVCEIHDLTLILRAERLKG